MTRKNKDSTTPPHHAARNHVVAGKAGGLFECDRGHGRLTPALFVPNRRNANVPPFVSVAATRITALAVICPVLTGQSFYSCYAGLLVQTDVGGMVSRRFNFTRPECRSDFEDQVSPVAVRRMVARLRTSDTRWHAGNWFPLAFITSAIAGGLLTWQGFGEGFATCGFLWAFRRQVPVFCNLSVIYYRNILCFNSVRVS